MIKVTTSVVQDSVKETGDAKGYWRSEGVHPAQYAAIPHFVAAIAEVVDTIRADRVFEFGCGSGRNMAALRDICANRYLQCSGVDISPSLISEGRKKFDLLIDEGDESALQSMEHDFYDLAFTVSVLDHLPDPSVALEHLARISKAYCLFIEPHNDVPANQSLRLEGVHYNRAQGKPEKSAPYTYIHDYAALFERHGLSVVLDCPLPTHDHRSGSIYRLWLMRKSGDGAPPLSEPAATNFRDRIINAAFLQLLSNLQDAGRANSEAQAAAQKTIADKAAALEQANRRLVALEAAGNAQISHLERLDEQIRMLDARLEVARRLVGEKDKEAARLAGELTRVELEAERGAQMLEAERAARLESEQKHLNAERRAEESAQRLRGVKAKYDSRRLADAEARAIAHVRESFSFRLGNALVLGVQSWRGFLALPGRLLALAAEKLRRHQATAAEAPATPATTTRPAPSHRIAAERRAPPPPLVTPRSKTLRIAGIMDEFTVHSYAPECELLQLHPENWREQLEAFKPDVLFIESAWKGKDDLWALKISNAVQEILDVVQWCRTQKILVVFWNKEDPVHFDTFLPMASQADYVFTTDIDCIPKYKYQLEHERVYLLPFAAQPEQHNPIERFERKDAFNFAGSYYIRYPERQRDFDTLIEAAEQIRPVEIYDRNYNNPHPHYTFPAKYADFILGNLPFSEIDRAYKGYRFGVNVNTIKQSQTMFARRVFELLASNTVVVSNFSRGVRLLFGDLTLSSDQSRELQKRLETLCADEHACRKLRLLGLRKVMSEHTYAHRLAYIRAKLSKEEYRPQAAGVVAAGTARSRREFDRLVAHFQRQQHTDKTLIILKAFAESVSTPDTGVQVFSEVEACLEALQAHLARLPFFALLHAEDYYGPAYLTDLVSADGYSKAAAFGKSAYYAAAEGACRLEEDGAQYRPAKELSLRSALVRANAPSPDLLRACLDAPESASIRLDDMLALDEFHYCRDGAALDTDVLRNVLEDLPLADQGVSLNKMLYPAAEALRAREAEEVGDASAPAAAVLPEINALDLFSMFAPSASTWIRLSEANGAFHIASVLPTDKHAYIYARAPLTREQCNFILDSRFKLGGEYDMDLRTVFEFRDARGEKISHSINPAGGTVALAIPPHCQTVRFGLRVRGAGKARIHKLTFGGLNERPALIVNSSPLLVLTKQYPTYDDLYKYGFLHSRLRGYRQQGVTADVFRLRSNVEDRYYSEFEGVDVATGDAGLLDATLSAGRIRHVLVHLMDQNMWEVLRKHIRRLKVTVWVHGAEIQPFHRREYNVAGLPPDEAERQEVLSEQRLALWRGLLQDMPENLHLVFVSKYLAEEVMEDLGFRIAEDRYSIIHNPIDTDLFSYAPKAPEQRKRILSIRPFSSRTYANDLSVAAILALRDKPFFQDLEFRLVGDGELFEEITAPLKDIANITLEKRFLTQVEIAALHKKYGVMLIPTRMDTQGVSRDEAMASGLVPITSRVAAVPEFVDESCGFLTEPEDAAGLARAIERLYHEPELFTRFSKAAAERVRRQASAENTIEQELALIHRDGEVS